MAAILGHRIKTEGWIKAAIQMKQFGQTNLCPIGKAVEKQESGLGGGVEVHPTHLIAAVTTAKALDTDLDPNGRQRRNQHLRPIRW